MNFISLLSPRRMMLLSNGVATHRSTYCTSGRINDYLYFYHYLWFNGFFMYIRDILFGKEKDYFSSLSVRPF